jgi:hypothetical protein
MEKRLRAGPPFGPPSWVLLFKKLCKKRFSEKSW